MSVLEAKNITKIFPGVKALEDVSVSFIRAKFIVLWEKMEQVRVH